MIHSKVSDKIKTAIEDIGYELWGCQYLAKGRGSLLRIYIDSPNGIGIEDCELVSRKVGTLLDVEDLISDNYTLEVSSPGIPRPLFYLSQFKKYIGEEVEIKLIKPIAEKRKFLGVIIAVDEQDVILNVDNQRMSFLFENIGKANLIFK